MKKSVYLFGLVVVLLLAGLAEAVSGFILWFALPSGSGRGSLNLTYWGVTRHAWIDIHDWVAIALMAVVVIHLAMHWKWVVRMPRQLAAQMTSSFNTNRSQSRAAVESNSVLVRSVIKGGK
jgi:preprotein translocase subunit SecY